MDTKRMELCERLDKALLKIQRIAVRPEVLEFVNPETYSGPSMAEVMACSFIADFDHSGDLSVKDIAAAIGLDHSTVSRLALNLERDGLIVRSQSQSDRRKTTISLTEAGQLVADNANQFRSWIISQLLTDWSDLEISELTNSLNRILQTTSEKLPDLIKQAHTKFDQNS